MGGVRYLSTPYYEHWLAAFERLLVEKGIVSAAAVERRLDAERNEAIYADLWERYLEAPA
jgi:hypothetical protein